MVGERGAELVELPTGSKVYGAGQTRSMLNNQGQGGDTIINITSPKALSPSETANEINKALKRFAYGL